MLNGLCVNFKNEADRQVYLKNRMSFPFVRGIHFVHDIESYNDFLNKLILIMLIFSFYLEDCTRIPNTSYIRPPAAYMDRKFPHDDELILKENLNRHLMQMPPRNLNLFECEDKTDYHNILFEVLL